MRIQLKMWDRGRPQSPLLRQSPRCCHFLRLPKCDSQWQEGNDSSGAVEWLEGKVSSLGMKTRGRGEGYAGKGRKDTIPLKAALICRRLEGFEESTAEARSHRGGKGWHSVGMGRQEKRGRDKGGCKWGKSAERDPRCDMLLPFVLRCTASISACNAKKLNASFVESAASEWHPVQELLLNWPPHLHLHLLHLLHLQHLLHLFHLLHLHHLPLLCPLALTLPSLQLQYPAVAVNIKCTHVFGIYSPALHYSKFKRRSALRSQAGKTSLSARNLSDWVANISYLTSLSVFARKLDGREFVPFCNALIVNVKKVKSILETAFTFRNQMFLHKSHKMWLIREIHKIGLFLKSHQM